MSDFLTREAVIGLQDITWKEITIPERIPVWGGKSLYIRMLTRGQQDEYMKRQFGQVKMKQDRKATSQELTQANIYGHDAWLCIQGCCDAQGAPLFQPGDEKMLYTKSGEAIGWIAKQIVDYSGMLEDVKDLQKAEEELKNSQMTQS